MHALNEPWQKACQIPIDKEGYVFEETALPMKLKLIEQPFSSEFPKTSPWALANLGIIRCC